MRVFLTGATGYIGSAVAERLRAVGHQVSALGRSDAAVARLSAAGIEPIRGDFADPKSVAAGARGADGVISLATTYDPAAASPSSIPAVSGRTATLPVKWWMKAPHPSRFLWWRGARRWRTG